MIISKSFKYELEINTHYLDRNRNFTDNGLINFGKSLENLLALNKISLTFCQ